MDVLKNPFSPGAGSPPPALAGRAGVLEEARVLLGRVLLGRAEKSIIMQGLRGVGKTVLLNAMAKLAKEQGYRIATLEAQQGVSLAQSLLPQLRKILLALDADVRHADKVRRAFLALRNVMNGLKLSFGDFSIDFEELPGLADSGNLMLDLPELLHAVADAAVANQCGIAILIDEIQNLGVKDLSALIMSMHRMQQTASPMVLIGAGLPTVAKLAGEAKSYAERLFQYPMIGELNEEDVRDALLTPIRRYGVTMEREAISAIYRQTHGYPYFLQEWGYQTWNLSVGPLITNSDVGRSALRVIERLDANFFHVRFDRLTDAEKRFLRAMANIPDEEKMIGDIAQALHVGTRSLGPLRAKLIEKGMIYSPRHGHLAYSVPLFGDFLRRAMPAG